MSGSDEAMHDAIAGHLCRLNKGKVNTHYLPPKVNGTVRLDIISNDGVKQYFVKLSRRRAIVSETGPAPGAVIRGERQYFNLLAEGRVRFIPLWFRNDLSVEGDLRLADAFGRMLMPGPLVGARDPRLPWRSRLHGQRND